MGLYRRLGFECIVTCDSRQAIFFEAMTEKEVAQYNDDDDDDETTVVHILEKWENVAPHGHAPSI